MTVIYLFKVLRLFGSLDLLVISVAAFVFRHKGMCAGGIAYAWQESWVQNETTRDNIMFGGPFDKKMYKKVVTSSRNRDRAYPYAL